MFGQLGGFVVIYSQADHDKVTATLRELLTTGRCLGEALWEMHHVRGVGLMWLVPAVVEACGLPKPEAQRVVARESLAPERPDLESVVGETCTVHVPLVGAGTAVWRPVSAVRVAPGVFRLGGPIPDGEAWAFVPGDLVRCAVRVFSGGEQGLAAFERAEVVPG